jgi:hypothetical protein
MPKLLFVLGCLLMAALSLQAQITSVTALMTEDTPYPSTTSDVIHYFDNSSNISLKANSSDPAEFTWRKLNASNNVWDVISSSTGSSSEITNIAEGCYEVPSTPALPQQHIERGHWCPSYRAMRKPSSIAHL